MRFYCKAISTSAFLCYIPGRTTFNKKRLGLNASLLVYAGFYCHSLFRVHSLPQCLQLPLSAFPLTCISQLCSPLTYAAIPCVHCVQFASIFSIAIHGSRLLLQVSSPTSIQCPHEPSIDILCFHGLELHWSLLHMYVLLAIVAQRVGSRAPPDCSSPHTEFTIYATACLLLRQSRSFLFSRTPSLLRLASEHLFFLMLLRSSSNPCYHRHREFLYGE